MNALLAVRSNQAGLANPTPKKRAAVQQELQANARAYVLGKMLKGAAIAKADGTQIPPPQNQLDRNAFLRLLLNQVQNQDPLNPMDNSAMVAQLAQFSSLEQMQNVSDGVSTLNGNIDQLNFSNAANLLGKQISGIDMQGNPIQGTVQNVQLSNSTVVLNVNGQAVSLAGVQAIQ